MTNPERKRASASASVVATSAASSSVVSAIAHSDELPKIVLVTLLLTADMMKKGISLCAITRVLFVMGIVAGVKQASAGCKHCQTHLDKEQKAMFRAHSDACLATSKADPTQVEAFSHGVLTESPELKAHVYCMLTRCKIISKDGKLQKASVLGNVVARGEGKDVIKILENCSDHQTGDTPEEMAWNLFRCGYDKKAILFFYMPTSTKSLV
uniref:Odorant-binding protein OBP13 n=1 Tax=Lobesia botrana TaxID=209534 RepID=A0A345BEQ3_9NEOP|nr:odorant-binding protein OBP13 [Lobesia botrana]